MSAKTMQGTPQWLGAVNDRTALALLLDHGVLTRNRIGELSGLSKPTASQIVARLEQAGLIRAVGEVSGGRGPNAASYAARLERGYGVAVDVTATTIRASLVDAAGTEHPIVERPARQNTATRAASGDLEWSIRAAAEAADVDPSSVRHLLVGVQGAIDPRTDELAFAEALPGWPRRRIRSTLEAALHRQVTIENDVNLAAVAERTQGAGAGTTDFALLWMGSGLGLAIDLAGAIVRGSGGGAGEIGYLPIPAAASGIDPAAVELQDLIGGRAISRMLRAHGVAGRTLEARFERLAAAERRNEALAELARRIAVGLVPVLAVADPGLVVLGGPTGAGGGEALADLVRTMIRRTTRWSPDVVATAVSEHPVLRGARSRLGAELRAALLDDVNALVT
ncbi:ROK family transcriptional regulator [Rathayibacter sp. YIM 133350]|uniref:ROK family transcriptional regulator n=1 Tax=Rathayibacter sp. YIM 133350 TaxID=3131992 RepID=UPI00307D897C